MANAAAPSVHIDAFFGRHPAFDYDVTQPIMHEFERMVAQLHWGAKRRKTQLNHLRGAMAEQFNAYYGTNVDDILAWTAMCDVLGIYPIPESMTARRKAVKSVHANIVDYIEAKRIDVQVKKFKSVRALANYSYRQGKIFPLAQAKAGGVLKYLLKELSRNIQW